MYLPETSLLADNKTPIRRKVIERGAGGGLRVYVDMQPLPFAALGDDALIDTSDLCLIFGCSGRTVYRWMSEHDLPHVGKAGRQYLFTKHAVIDWYNDSRPRPGRPPQAGR